MAKLEKYDSIIVVGAQRSGTQIVSKIIAEETCKQFVHEREYDVHDFDKMLSLIDNSVIHCPALTHKIGAMPPYVAIVFVVRDFNDIIFRRSLYCT